MSSGVWAVVPVKSLRQAKTRLASVLTLEERHCLAYAMLKDVLGALTAAKSVQGVMVVTVDAEAAALARSLGIVVEPDRECAGQSRATVQGATALRNSARPTLMMVPGDVPLITADDVDAVARGHDHRGGISLGPDVEGGGTNLLCMSPPNAMMPSFGEGSLCRHMSTCATIGVTPWIVRNPRFARDIDRPGDLRELLATAVDGHAFRYLNECGIAARLKSNSEERCGSR